MKKLLLTALTFIGLSSLGYAQSLDFDGVDDYVSIPRSISGDFTIEYWVKTTQTGGGGQWYNGAGLVDGEVGGVADDFGTVLSGNKFGFGVGNPDITIVSTTSINDGIWHHVAATREQSTGTMNIYVDGVLEATNTGGNTNALTSPGQLTIGSIQTGINFFVGEIDELKIWNVVRTGNQIADNMNCSLSGTISGLIANYNFNEGIANGNNPTVTVLTDISGNSNDGTLANFALTGTTSNWVGDVNLISPVASVSINAGVTSVCAGTTVTFTATPVNGGSTPSYQWIKNGGNVGTNSNMYADATLTSTDVISCQLISSISCATTATSNTVSITVPAISISGTTAICSGNSTTLTASGLTSYTWSANAGSATTTTVNVSPGSTDTYTVTGDDGTCSNTQTVTVNVTATPTLGVSGNLTPCSANSTTLTASGATSYTWNPGANTSNPIIIPAISTPGTYTFSLTGVTGICTSTYTSAIVVTATPTVNINGIASICSGNNTVLTASGATTFTWSANAGSATTATVSVNAAGIYTVTGDNGNGCISTKTFNVSVTATPTVNISGTSAICSGNSTILTASGATTFTWSANAATATTATVSVSPSSTDTYTVTGDNGGGCISTQTYTVNVTTTPTVNISGTSAICSGNNTVLTASGASTFTWSTNAASATSATVSVSPSSTDTYTVTGDNGGGCTSTQTYTVNVTATPTVNISGTSAICAGSNTTLTASGASTFTWSSNAASATTATVSVSPANTDTYTVTGDNGGGCTSTQTFVLTVNSLPVVTTTATVSNPTACGATDGSITGMVVSGTATLQYAWNGGSSQASPDLSGIGAGPYSLIITDGNNCTQNGGTYILSDPGAPAAPTFTTTANAVCEGGSFSLTIDSPNGSATYSWTGPSGAVGTGTMVTINNASVAQDNGGYVVQITLSGCSSSSASQTVTVNALPTVGVNSPAICAGSTATLTATGASTYTWSTTETTASISPTPTITANYTVTGTDANNCTNTATATVTVNNLPTVTFDMNPNMYCLTDPTVTLTATPAGGTFSGTGVTGNQFDPSTGAATYTLNYTYTDGNSCTNSDTAVVNVQTCGMGINHFNANSVSIYPNPASDLLNIQISVLSENTILEIYNNLGQKVSSVLLNSNNTQLNISGLNAGVYEARILNNNSIARQIKFIKQ
jgi:hypothetical protein